MTAIILQSEAERLAAVRRYDILDTPPDGAFDRVTRITARLFDVPIAIVSIVDHDRIWFKSHHGLDVEEIPRSPGLCASAILDNKPWVLNDARIDPRSLSNPLVAGEFGLRFYAGVPLHTHDGFNLGTLCVIDREPRAFSPAETEQLADLAAIVMDELELRRAAKRRVAEKQVLVREVYHRVKNNLQVIASLLALQSRSVPAEVKAHFDESLRRIRAMGLLHEGFYQEQEIGSRDLTAYLGELLTSVISTFGMEERVSARVEGPVIPIGLDLGTPIALLATEVISNACKHAFPGKRKGEIAIKTAVTDDQITLVRRQGF
ncbi:MAG TPA: histidine kinase dimerization/phosphoacceptor domain -containing protein [Mesorhizobium sp.]|jgi:two-component sensor histidine kinase|nr:histidine kinase dimerization/phosphoacceptor domain -containing protein [Mesorhizobium sp.]